MVLQKIPKFVYDILLAAFLCFPIIFSPSSKLLGSPDIDVWNHAWGPWWWSQTLLHGELPWETTYLHWPNGGVLWYIDPVMALLGAPLALIHPALAYNFVLVFYIAFASWAIRKFAKTLGADNYTEWFASLAFATSGWIMSEVHNGISEAVNIGPAALAFAWIEQACRNQNRKLTNWLWAGLGVGICFLASPYLGIGVGLAALIRGLPDIKYAWAGALSALPLAVLPVWILQNQLDAENAIIKRPPGMNEELALHNAVDPRTFIAPFGFQSRDLTEEGFLHTMYLGIVALFLTLWGFRKHRWWLLSFLLCMVCSLGPFLYWGDGWVAIGDAKLRLPWWYLQQAVPSLAITHPLRIAVPCLAIVSGVAAAELARYKWFAYRHWFLLGALLDNLLICQPPWPLQTASGEFPEIYQQVKADPRDVGVLDLPTDVGMKFITSRYLYWQAAHGKGIPYAPDARANTSSLLRSNYFLDLANQCQLRKGVKLPPSSRGWRQTADIKRDKIGWIIVHEQLDPLTAPRLIQILREKLGEPTVTTESATAWKIE